MDSEKPVTQAQLDAALKTTRDELSHQIASAVNHVVETLGARMDRMGEELRELSRDAAAMREELSRDAVAMREELSRDAVAMREELSRELAGHVRAAAEENRQFLAVLDDRYRDLPPRVTLLERELDEHRRDTVLHPRRRRK